MSFSVGSLIRLTKPIAGWLVGQMGVVIAQPDKEGMWGVAVEGNFDWRPSSQGPEIYRSVPPKSVSYNDLLANSESRNTSGSSAFRVYPDEIEAVIPE